MAQQNQIIKPRSLNMDVSKKYLKETEAFYLLNYDILNPSSIGKGVPYAANAPLCDMEMPSGETHRVGSCYSPITNETYAWIFNENEINFISRINGDGVCVVVYHNDGINNCLKLSANPRQEITKWRAYLYVEKSDCANRAGKYLVWTNGENEIGFLDVEASIATQNFTTTFFDNCISGCEPLQLCVPQPCECLTAQYIPLPQSEQALNNQIVDIGFKFVYRGIYYNNLQASEWSDPSTFYFENAESCFFDNRGASRCIKLRVPIMNPLVDKIQLGYTKGDGIYYLFDTVEKYKKYNSSQQMWYERELSESLLNYSDCHFDYIFCNDKQITVIDSADVSRVFNPMPNKAQGLMLIDKGFGFYNYEQGNCPLDQTEVAKFSITQNCPADTDCVSEMRTLIVRAIIHSTISNTNQFVWRKGGAVNDVDDITDTAFFGGFENTFINAEHDQQFAGTIRDFIIYVEGSDYFGITTQLQSDAGFVGTNEVGVLGGASSGDGSQFIASINDVRADGGYYVQEAKILIPKGMKGFLRICSHHATGLQPDTSTQVIGVMDDITDYVLDSPPPNFNKFQFEIPFECGDTDILAAFIIDDTTLGAHDGNHSSVATVGYIKDDIGRPLEGLEIWASTEDPDIDNIVYARTDYNGYYFLYNWEGKIKNNTAGIYGELDCDAWTKIQPIILNRTQYRQTITANAKIANQTYLNNFYSIVNATVKECNGNPVEGVKIALSGSKSQITQSNGIAQFRIRNYKERNRQITAIIMSKFNCYIVDCDGICNPCYPSATASTDACYDGKPTITLPVMTLSIQSALNHSVGLKSGGLYPFGFVVVFGCGNKISAVNELPPIQIDSTQNKGKLSFCTFNFDATGMVLPTDATCLKIVRGQNINNYILQWVVDKIEKTPDQKIKITIQSLNDYNFKYFEKTNTNYQYINGDRVEFIFNGDGKPFDTATYGTLNYQVLSPFLQANIIPPDAAASAATTANYFNQILIEDDGRLDNLDIGAIIEFQRPKASVSEPTYFSICASIPANNGKLLSETGTFQTFDTFLVERQIGDFSVKTFEHKTPSDFWGLPNVDDTGKPFFINKYENERRYGRNISISDPNQLNRFGDIVKIFDAPEQGDITAANIVDGKIILAIGENDSFLAQASNDLLRVGSDNFVRAASADQVISDAEPKIRGMFGCSYDDIGSILFTDGYATWIDAKRNGHVKHNYSLAVDISLDKMQAYFRRKIQDKNIANKAATNDLDKVRWVTGENNITNAVMLTLTTLRENVINNEPNPFNKINTTLVCQPENENETYLTFTSFTPEGYTILDLEEGTQFIAYYNGVPYTHNSIAVGFNKFFGTACDMYAGIAANKYPEKLKNFIALELQDKQMWFAKEVTTNEEDFISEVPPVKVKAIGQKWNFSFLGNSNSREGLYGKEMPHGYFCSVLLIRDNTDELKYNTINAVKQQLFSEIDLILVKYNFFDSGFQENL